MAPPRRGPVSALRTHVAGDSLRRGAIHGLDGGSGHMGEAGFRQKSVSDLFVAARGCPPRCCLGVRIRPLVTLHPAVGGNPVNRNFVVSGKDRIACLHRRGGETLAWTQDVGPHPVYGGSGVDEDCVPMATLLAPAQDPERLVNGESLHIDYPSARPEVERTSGPATR